MVKEEKRIHMVYTTHFKRKVLTALLIAATIGVMIALQEFTSNEMAAGHVLSAAESKSRPAEPAQSYPLSPEQSNNLSPTNCRYGAGLVAPDVSAGSWLTTLKAGWYLNYSSYKSYTEPNSEFIFTVRLWQLKADGVRFDEYTVTPPATDFYHDENGSVKPGLGYFVDKFPGATWVVGNEIDIDNSWQDNIMPALYAEAYHEVYHYIKSVDPTAKVGIGSVLQGTPGRFQYLDIVLDTYQSLYGAMIPIDVWNTHFYILPERTMSSTPQYADGKIALGTDPNLAIYSTGNPALCPPPDLPDTPENDPRADVYCRSEHDSVRIFSEQVRNFRSWMAERGQQDKPLIITEFGILRPFVAILPDGTCNGGVDEFGNCFPPDRVSRYLLNTTDFLENASDPSIGYPEDDYRLVQRWAWYSLYTSHLIGNSSNMLLKNYHSNFAPGATQALSPIGQVFRDQAVKHGTVNLAAESAIPTNVFVEYPGDRGTATLTATFRNDGSYSIVQPFTVTFYSDAALTSPIGSVVVNPANTGPLMGCSWIEDAETVSVTWSDLPVGTYDYWAKIDSDQTINEIDETDNVTIRGQVGVYATSDYAYSSFVPFSRGE